MSITLLTNPSWLQLRFPDSVIRAEHNVLTMQFVMRSDLCRESLQFRRAFERVSPIPRFDIDRLTDII